MISSFSQASTGLVLENCSEARPTPRAPSGEGEISWDELSRVLGVAIAGLAETFLEVV